MGDAAIRHSPTWFSLEFKSWSCRYQDGGSLSESAGLFRNPKRKRGTIRECSPRLRFGLPCGLGRTFSRYIETEMTRKLLLIAMVSACAWVDRVV